jgi:hypothetical protein
VTGAWVSSRFDCANAARPSKMRFSIVDAPSASQFTAASRNQSTHPRTPRPEKRQHHFARRHSTSLRRTRFCPSCHHRLTDNESSVTVLVPALLGSWPSSRLLIGHPSSSGAACACARARRLLALTASIIIALIILSAPALRPW